MERTGVQKLAWVLKILVTITFICNLFALVLVPFLVENRFRLDLGHITATIAYDLDDGVAQFFPYRSVWYTSFTTVLTCFLLFCGVCTAVILWQARRVLNTILRGTPFCRENGANLRRAAVCCFLISLFALIRLVWGFFYYGSLAPLLTYNALFVPVFFMGGLLCLVMSALFRQAAELKEENDLTI